MTETRSQPLPVRPDADARLRLRAAMGGRVRRLPAVWLTPVLTDEPTVAALRRSAAPCLLIGGTADKLWDGRLARSVTPHVLEITGADHGMLVPGSLSESAAVLGQVITAVENFLDHQVWPQGDDKGNS